MGVSRSASVVIAYAMKAYNWDFKKALEFVRQKRTCIKPNTSFVSQLETYQVLFVAPHTDLECSSNNLSLETKNYIFPTGHFRCYEK